MKKQIWSDNNMQVGDTKVSNEDNLPIALNFKNRFASDCIDTIIQANDTY